MKKFYLVIASVCLFLTQSISQGQHANTVYLSFRMADTTGLTTQTEGAFTLNSSTSDFSGEINLFPIVPAANQEDSMAAASRPLILQISGQFPTGDISFKSPSDNIRQYSMPCRCRIYDSLRICTFNFSLLTLRDQSGAELTGSGIYQSRMNFLLVIDPDDFGLRAEPFAINRPVMIFATNCVINKSP